MAILWYWFYEKKGGLQRLLAILSQHIIIVCAIIAYAISNGGTIGAETITIAWDAGADPFLTYNLYFGAESRAYTNVIPAGTNTVVQVPDLAPGTYYFAATAVNSFGLESPWSDELVYQVLQQWIPQIVVTDLNQMYDGTPKTATVRTSPLGLPVTITYNSKGIPPTAPGTYSVVARLSSPWLVVSSNLLTITKAQATVRIGQLDQWFDGSPKPVAVTTDPQGLAVEVSYEGGPEIPVCPGTYKVFARVQDPNYEGVATATLVIQEPPCPVVILTWPAGSYDVTLKQSLDLIGWTTLATIAAGSSNSFMFLQQSIESFFSAAQSTSNFAPVPLRIQRVSPQ